MIGTRGLRLAWYEEASHSLVRGGFASIGTRPEITLSGSPRALQSARPTGVQNYPVVSGVSEGLVPLSAKPSRTKRRSLRRETRGASPPRPPLRRRLRGPLCPAPLRRLARSCSLVSWPRLQTLGEQLVPSQAKPPTEKLGGLRPREPPYGVARGAPLAPLRSADSLAPARSFHGHAVQRRWVRTSYQARRSRLQRNSGGFAPATPLRRRSRGPPCPAPLRRLARSCSLVSWPRGPATLGEQLVPSEAQPPKRNSGGFAPANPPTASLAGPPLPRSAPPTRSLLLARFMATRSSDAG